MDLYFLFSPEALAFLNKLKSAREQQKCRFHRKSDTFRSGASDDVHVTNVQEPLENGDSFANWARFEM